MAEQAQVAHPMCQDDDCPCFAEGEASAFRSFDELIEALEGNLLSIQHELARARETVRKRGDGLHAGGGPDGADHG